MSEQNEKRSSVDEIQACTQGVGARQGDPPPASRGGGYLDICIESRFAVSAPVDPRLEELREIGLSRLWLQVAELVGVDTFLEVWRLLDEEGDAGTSGVRVYMPRHKVYQRFQRNRYIQSLAAQGESVPAIRQRLQRELREFLSPRHIQRVITRT